MPVDASIPLAANPGQLNWSGPNALLAYSAAAQKLKAEQAQLQNQNSLRNILASPQAMGPDGNYTGQALQSIMALDPSTGMKLRQDMLDQQIAKAQAKHYESETGKVKWDVKSGLAGVATDAYDRAKAAGASDKDAGTAATAARNAAAQQSGGLLGDDEINAVIASPFDPVAARSFARTNKEWSTTEKDAAKTASDARRLDLQEARDAKTGERTDALIAATLGKDPTAAKWEVLTDKDGSQYRYNPATAKATTLDGKDYSPQGAAKLASAGGGSSAPASVALKKYLEENPNATSDEITAFMQRGKAARSPATAAVAKYMQENPNASAEDISQEAAKVHSQQIATTAFATGKQGQQINSFNVGIAHLDTMSKLADALKNGNVPAFNRIGNAVAEQTGKAAPTNFETAKAIVGDEIIKAIIGGGGALADRENAQNQLDRAKTPEQLQGVIRTYKDLMAGQLHGLQQQYEQTTGKSDFGTRLTPEAKGELETLTTKKAGATPSGPVTLPHDNPQAAFDALPSGAIFIGPDGKQRKKP